MLLLGSRRISAVLYILLKNNDTEENGNINNTAGTDTV
jgi:hypothetical protein